MQLLGGLEPAQFLARYWQRRPLLVRGALPDWRDPLSADELAGLACDPLVESRLVMERGGARPWQLIEGPQAEKRLRGLPRTHWTLLVQEADRHVPALRELAERFDFLPRWRLDDVMVSFAPPHGSVGPHIDSYDVFLLQGGGRRRWQIGKRARPVFRRGLDVRILEHFEPKREWVLEPGDMLYLPPGVAHYGVSLEAAFTYSIGFRAPSARDLAAVLARHLMEAGDDTNAVYTDPPGLTPPEEGGEIGPKALAHFARMVRPALARISERLILARAAGELMTEPKNLASRPRLHRLSSSDVCARVEAGDTLVRRPTSRAAFYRRPDGMLDLFVDGRTWPLPAALASLGIALTRAPIIERALLRRALRSHGGRVIVTYLVNAGAFDLQPARAELPGSNTPGRRRR